MTHRQFVWSMILIALVAMLIVWAIPYGQDFIADWKELVYSHTQVK